MGLPNKSAFASLAGLLAVGVAAMIAGSRSFAAIGLPRCQLRERRVAQVAG